MPELQTTTPTAPLVGNHHHRAVWYNGWLAALLLLIVYATLVMSAAWHTTVTFDETAHLPAGLSYWTMPRFIFNPENGNLPQRIGSLPLWLRGDTLPPTAHTTENPGLIWDFGQNLLFGSSDQPVAHGHAENTLRLARTTMTLLGVACGALIYFWSRRLFNPTGAMVSLLLFTFCPTFLAHGPLITSDVAAAFFFIAAVGSAWWMMHQLSLASVLTTGMTLGCLCLSKMSAPLVLPVIGLMLTVRLVVNRPLIVTWWAQRCQVIVTPRSRQTLWLIGSLLVTLLIAWVMLWGAYDFRFIADPARASDGSSFLGWPWVLRTPGFITSCVQWARDWQLLPESYLYGFAFTIEYSRGRNAFLNGEFSSTGWPQYFPLAFLMKTPLLSLGILLLAIFAAIASWTGSKGQLQPHWRRKLQRGLYRTAPLWLFLIIYWLAAVTSNLNIGIRHMLPAYAAFYILAGAAGAWLLHHRKLVRTGVATLILVFALESTLAWPHYLSYFNQTVGGPSQGYRHLIDSNLDWGQDLPYVKTWLVSQGLDRPQNESVPPGERVYFSYFGNGNLQYHGLQVTQLTGFHLPDQQPPFVLPKLEPGVYIISATMLSGTYFSPIHGSHWLPKYEQAYQTLFPEIARLLATGNDHAARLRLIDERGAQYWIDTFILFRKLRDARLCAYLRQREPDARITHSYLVYVLRADELQLLQNNTNR